MPKNNKINGQPMPVVVHQMAYKRLFVLLTSLLEIKDKRFHEGLTRLLKGLYFKCNGDFYQEGSSADVAAYISKGIGFSYYMHPLKGKVVNDIFSAGEVALNPDSFFNNEPADAGLEFISGSVILYLTAEDVEELYDGIENVERLTIKTLSRMFKHMRAKDELQRLTGKDKVRKFFDLYPALLQSARKAPMQFRDIASYLVMDPSHFSILVKELYPNLND